ncbi:TTC17-like protein [Mya arenaria]|uniref:TTC17-like protein n=1 Tax=Mya arenaria TaxID=6604 RepID=A0ABY7F015_MYAAR|nr:TTC17-like protein [Mya arenaria]
MTYDLPCMSYMAMYLISVHIVNSNSRSSVGANHWRLNVEEGKVLKADDDLLFGNNHEVDDDAMFRIITNQRIEDGQWLVDSQTECTINDRSMLTAEQESPKNDQNKKATTGKDSVTKGNKKLLTCGKPANFTQYDHLRGITQRGEHPHIPEPEVAIMFRKKGAKASSDVDMTELESRLKKLKKQTPRTPSTYSQIGNFWRIKGNTQLSIECFRKALAISPNSPDVLLYLARILFNLQFLDDAIFLTRRSLAMQPENENSWHQHFTLGEILKAYGHYQEASLHFQQALRLNPGFQRAEAHLRDMEGTPNPSMTQYTLFIILFLIMGVVFGVITSMEANYEETTEGKPQRHFNRAMAMRSMKLGINPRLIRMRKMNGV